MAHDAPGTDLDQLRDIFIDARVVELEIAPHVLGQQLDAAEVDMLSAFRRAGWHAVRLDPPGSGAWVTLVHLTNESVGLQRFGPTGEPVADEAWFTIDATGVAAIAAALRRAGC
jgi:hypothetical protein